MRKMTFLIGGAVGYVLGARAGRDQYDRIKGMAMQAKENPKVQEAAGKVSERGGELMHGAQGKLGDVAGKAAEKAPDWVPGTRSAGSGDPGAPITPATTAKSTSTATPTAMSGSNSRTNGS